jgi:DNA-directed RNA polymerase subunit M/transcription elongation factor TFIIS
MAFCKECDSILYPSELEGKLWNKCSDCGYKEEYTETIIDKKNYKQDKEKDKTEISKYIIYDSTIPRTIHKDCPFKDCISHKDPSKKEYIFIQDPITIKLTYICVNCNTKWNYS